MEFWAKGDITGLSRTSRGSWHSGIWALAHIPIQLCQFNVSHGGSWDCRDSMTCGRCGGGLGRLSSEQCVIKSIFYTPWKNAFVRSRLCLYTQLLGPLPQSPTRALPLDLGGTSIPSYPTSIPFRCHWQL